MIVVGE